MVVCGSDIGDRSRMQSITDVLDGFSEACLVRGEALDLYQAVPDGVLDAVVTDPPYCNTGDSASVMKTSGKGFSLPKETQFFEAWIREHLTLWSRLLKPDGVVWLTVDWRGAMALDAAAARLGFREPKVGVWDRGGLGLGYALRSTYECFAVVPMSAWEPLRRDVPDVWRHPWSPAHRKHGHSAEKPVPLIRQALSVFTRPGALVLDPFAGSGTTGKACAEEGRRFIGFEREDVFVERALSRLDLHTR